MRPVNLKFLLKKISDDLIKLTEAVGNKFQDFGQQQSDQNQKSQQNLQHLSKVIQEQLTDIRKDNEKHHYKKNPELPL